MILSVFKEFYNMQKNLFNSPLKRRLSDRGYVDKRVIRPSLAKRALAKLIKVNSSY